jgi:atlastin
MVDRVSSEADSTTESMPDNYPRPVQIVNVDMETRKFVLDEKALASILLNEQVKNRPVAVVSIAGDFRKGKSFMLNFFLRYLKNLEKGSPEKWLDDKEKPLKGML